MEFVWRPSFETPEGRSESSQEIFTHIMHAQYQGDCEIDIWTPYSDEGMITMTYRH